MTGKLQLLAFLAIAAICAGASQKFYSQGRRSVLSKTSNNYNSKCSTAVKAYRSIVMNRKHYRAYSVCSDGHILLLPNTGFSITRYTKPSSLRYRRRNAIVAAFWANNKYRCKKIRYKQYYWPRYNRRTYRRRYSRPSRYYRRRRIGRYRRRRIGRYRRRRIKRYRRRRIKRYRRRRIGRYRRRYRWRYRWSCPSGLVRYGQSCTRTLMNQISSLVNDAHFKPTSAVWATYTNMRPLIGSQRNNFQIILATHGSVTYAVFIYRSMGWQKSCTTCSGPFMGYSTEKGRGYQYSLPRSAARHLSHSIKIFRISDYQYSSTTTAKAQYDEQTVAKLQDALNEVAGEVEVQGDDEDDDIAMTTEDADVATTTEDGDDVAMTTEDDDVAMTTEDDDDDAMTTEDDDDDDAMITEDDDDDDDDAMITEDDDDDDDVVEESDDNMTNALKDTVQAALEEEGDDEGGDDNKDSSSQEDTQGQGDKASKKKSKSGTSSTM